MERIKIRAWYLGITFTICLIALAFLILPINSVAQSMGSVDEVIKLKAIEGLKYDKSRLVVEPGSTIRIDFKNEDEMLHNLLITKPGTRVDVVELAESMGSDAVEKNYIPVTSNVLASTQLLEPNEEASIIFQVPEETDVYPYVCTFPAHGRVMYGAIYVTNNPDELPRIDEDPNIPEPVRNEMAAANSMHPYPMKVPVYNRLFMPESSPASIAVGMEKDQSYNWDAGYSYLRYVWNGGYIDASDQWDAKAKEIAKVVGEIYYKNTTGFPFRVGNLDSIPEPDFKGYKIVDGYLQFMYKMGDIMVHELILPADATPGFELNYTLENVNEPLWYLLSNQKNLEISHSRGEQIDSDILKLSPEEAKEFTITIVPEEIE